MSADSSMRATPPTQQKSKVVLYNHLENVRYSTVIEVSIKHKRLAFMALLTGSIRLNVDDLGLGSVDLVLIRRRQLRFDHDGVLGPGLQRSDQVPRVVCLLSLRGTRRRIDIGDHPAVRAAGVLSIKLGDVLIRPVAHGTKTTQRPDIVRHPCVIQTEE